LGFHYQLRAFVLGFITFPRIAPEPAAQQNAPELAHGPLRIAPLPSLNIPLKVKNAGHQKVVDSALPMLMQVIGQPDWCTKVPREQVKFCLSQVDLAGDRFWGVNQHYTRRRTVEDLILKFYYDDIKAML